MNRKFPKLEMTDLDLVVCQFLSSMSRSIPASILSSDFFSITKTKDELSIVCPSDVAPSTVRVERDFCCFRVKGPLDFSLTGILSSILQPLAEKKISIFAISTYDTDYVLVRRKDLKGAKLALTDAGFEIGGEQNG